MLFYSGISPGPMRKKRCVSPGRRGWNLRDKIVRGTYITQELELHIGQGGDALDLVLAGR